MNPQIDDPILTAYALGELNAEERAAVDARLANDAEARQFVEETRAFANDLADLLKAAPPADLTPEQKNAILAEAHEQGAGGRKIIPLSRWIAPVALAASVTVALVLTLREGEKPVVVRRELTTNTLAEISKPLAANTPIALSKSDEVKQLLAQSSQASETTDYEKSYVDYGKALNGSGSTAGVDKDSRTKMENVASQPLSKTNESSEEKPGDENQINTISSAATIASADSMGGIPSLPHIPAEAPNRLAEYKRVRGENTVTDALTTTRQQLQASLAGQLSDKKDKSQLEASAASPVAAPMSEDIPRAIAGFSGGWAAKQEQPADGALPGLVQREPGNTEAYDRITDNAFLAVRDNPLSTFSIDVDTASYANVRRFLDSGSLPPKDSVRIEELINYFDYDYPQPKGDDPFSVNVEVAPAPWNTKHLLAKIGLKGREIAPEKRPAMNLVFLLDVSGSMDEPNKLPLVRQSMKLLVDRLKADDRVAIVVYAGASGMALPSTPASHKHEIDEAIDSLSPGGSTNGAAGIQLAYDIAKANFIKDGANRVILCTDGDFNVGVTNQGDLLRLIENKAKSGTFLTVLGFGMGNYKDSTLEKLADKGNGNYGYVDTEREAKKLLVDQLGGTLVTIAKDVKIQMEFNPAQVGAYRLIGYENRLLAAQDFNDDKKDAGEIGAGHTVTALYELTPVGDNGGASGVDPLKYQPQVVDQLTPKSNEMMTVKLRYKQPDGDTSKLITETVPESLLKSASVSAPAGLRGPSKDFQFAAAVAEFGMILRESPFKGDATWKSASDLAENGLGDDKQGYRHEFLKLIQRAQQISESQ